MRFANPLKRTRHVVSTRGHALEFPGKSADGALTFVHVPHAVQAEAIAAGLVPENEIEEVEAPTGPVRPQQPEAFKAAVFAGFSKMVDRADRDEFAGNGFPRADALSKQLGFKVEGREVKDMWPLFQSAVADERA